MTLHREVTHGWTAQLLWKNHCGVGPSCVVCIPLVPAACEAEAGKLFKLRSWGSQRNIARLPSQQNERIHCKTERLLHHIGKN